MRKLLLFLSAICLIALTCCTSQKNRALSPSEGQQDQISAHIEGWGNDTILVHYYILPEDEGFDTIIARNGRFGYNMPKDVLTEVWFYRRADTYHRRGGNYLPTSRTLTLLVVGGERLKVEGKAREDLALEYTVRGSELMDDMSSILGQTLIYEIKKDSNEFGLTDAAERGASAEEQQKFFDRRRELNGKIREIEKVHIQNYPDRLSSGRLALNQRDDVFTPLYMMLSENVKNSAFKELLDSRIVRSEEYRLYLENQKKEFAGNLAPDFTLTDINGREFALSGFDTAGKYIVLDFWGSWCGPCLMGMPEMKKYYEKYGSKLEIIGIACRDKAEAWKKMVADKELPWIHLLNDESSAESNVAARYAVEGYPTKIILSPDKYVVAKFLGEGEDFYKKLDELLGK